MSFVRPEARQALWRWREVIWALVPLAVGGWWMAGAGGLLPWVGSVIFLAGVAFLVAGIQRGRFRIGKGGPGVVQVTEGQIAYFGPHTGGAVALTELSAVELVSFSGTRWWALHQPGRAVLHIPSNAEGAEALFDVFAHLPGIRTEHMLAQMRLETSRPATVWQRDGPHRIDTFRD
ncbi:hypothetical protein DQW77_12870 [Roseovarius sp. TE539]|uniref:hypothetical protein n=1 Tax=Roseovarius sp. TE539 TaxID=2249812 RepID=UPI000DE00B99|nr:hypothetical protein [Roseovarius sp. TE539]RBI71154.1 hypothetical protein DQW77_12870 [Roseovarius sp. TE539]